MNTPREFYTVSRVIEMTGLPPESLSRLERELGGVLEIRHTSGGNRLFTPKDVASLREIKRLLDEEGKNLDEARALLFPGSGPSPADTLPGFAGSDMAGDDPVVHARVNASDRPDPDSQVGARLHLTVEPADTESLAVEVRSSSQPDRTDESGHDTPTDDEATMDAEAAVADPLDAVSSLSDDVDPEAITVPQLPVGPTVDLLLEATEGLVQENLKLRKAVDALAERCLRVEERLGDIQARRGLFGLFRR